MDHSKKRLLAAAFSVGVVVVGGAPHYHRMRPQVNCCLPDRDYQYRSFSQPIQSFSASPVLVANATTSLPPTPAGKASLVPSPPPDPPRVKAFQFVENATLRSDHCSVSRISVLLHASGDWSISMRAEQNPLVSPASPPDLGTNERSSLLTGHLQRNEFHLEIRCYAASGPGNASGSLGKPLVVPLRVPPFWVQRQQPQTVYKTGHDQRIADFFELIDRAEVEFRYRHD